MKMKDAQLKQAPSLMPKSSIKKESKKQKEPKVPLKPSRNRRVSKLPEKKTIKKEEDVKIEKRKRGRPRNSERQQNKNVKEFPKASKKTDEPAKSTRKRKFSPSFLSAIKIEPDCLPESPPPKKPKTTELSFSSMNGNAKSNTTVNHKQLFNKSNFSAEPEVVVLQSNICNGILPNKKTIFGMKKENSLDAISCKNSTCVPKKNLLNGNSWPPFNDQSIPNDNNLPKDQIIPRLLTPKEVKKEKPDDTGPIYNISMKGHPQRMASLDAMAKMHVICTTERKTPSDHRPKTPATQVGVKKECLDLTEEATEVKEKKVFISRSVEKSTAQQMEEQTETSTPDIKEKPEAKIKALGKPRRKVSPESVTSTKKTKTKPQVKLLQDLPSNQKVKEPKAKPEVKKAAKTQNKTSLSKPTPKPLKSASKSEVKSCSGKKPARKTEKTKSEVKVKETIRMQKTCTYESVTTVNSNSTTNSSLLGHQPVNHMTTNYSKTKKTVVTDDENRNKKVETTSGSEVLRDSYCVSTESQCSIGHHSECCKYLAHTSPQIIPFAHVQSCSSGHGISRTADSASASTSHCDQNFSMHRFGHQQQIIYSPSHHSDCGCCCSNSLVQTVRDSCLLRKGIVSCTHLASHSRLSSNSFSPETLCSDCHSGSTSGDNPGQHFTLPSTSSHSNMNCCTCCELHRDPSQHHHQSTGSCLQYLSSPKSAASLLPCEQSPLDLSLTSNSSGSSGDTELSLQQQRCPKSLCCRDLIFLGRSSTPHTHTRQNFAANKSCFRCNKQICEQQSIDGLQQYRCSTRSIGPVAQQTHQSIDCPSLMSSSSSSSQQVNVVQPIMRSSSPSGVANNNISILTNNILLRENLSSRLLLSRKRKFAHGWSWDGSPVEKLIALTNDSIPCPRKCYPAVRHKEGDIIEERDCVLLKSGPKDTDLPYVAKIAAFWENPEDGEMMMSLLWYYRPEHTEQGRKPGQMEDEVFASKHRDANSVACIEDKCYVLTFAEYCRYRAQLAMGDEFLRPLVIPQIPGGYPRLARLPPGCVCPDMVFFCRSVYDFRQKRILKNPS